MSAVKGGVVSPELAFEFTVALGRWERGVGDGVGHRVPDFLFPAEAPQGGRCQGPGTRGRAVPWPGQGALWRHS